MSKKDDAFWGQAFDPDAPLAKTGKPWKKLGSDNPKSLPLLCDGDIFAYRAAAPCDGKYYALVDTKTQDILAEERYKKEIMKVLDQYDNHPNPLEVTTKFRPEPEAFAIYNVDKMMASLLEKYPNAWVRTYLTGNTNFRAELNPEYKANRKNVAKPIHLNACKQHLLNRYNAELRDLYEADDLIGIAAMEMFNIERDYRIVTIDKDLNCIPGGHWNFVKGEEYDVTEQEALEFFYAQCLTGDKVDNIEGIYGIGPVKAKKIVDGAFKGSKGTANETNIYIEVLKAWGTSLFPDKKQGTTWSPNELDQAAAALQRAAEQLWILQEEGIMYNPPITVQDLFKRWEAANAMESQGSW